MKIAYAAALAFTAVSAPLLAQDAGATPAAATADSAAAVKRGATIFSSDGRRIGRVDKVRADSVGLIYNGKYVDLPRATLTAGDRGLVTSLSRAQIGKN